MDQKQMEKAVQALKQRLVHRFGNDVELRIFGSAARGDYHEHSDIDILAVLPVPVDNAIEEQVFDMASNSQREVLIAQIEGKLKQKETTQSLFGVRWV